MNSKQTATGHYTKEIKMPTTKQDGLANFIQMIINSIERGEVNEALLLAVDLKQDVTSAAGIYRTEEDGGAKLAALQSELQAKHAGEVIEASKRSFEDGKRAARREIAEKLGVL